MVGKDPHRPQGKTKDAERMGEVAYTKDPAYTAPSQNEMAQNDRELMRQRGGPTHAPAEEEIGGSRPGVPSRVKEAIQEREAREG